MSFDFEDDFWEKENKSLTIIFVIFSALVLFWICLSCCRNYTFKGKKLTPNADSVIESPVVVTSATHTAPGGYPVTQLPPPGYPQSPVNVYSPTPYPAQPTSNVTVQMPMPMPQQQQPGMPTSGVTPYPPMPQPGMGAAAMNPPSYDMAMAQPGPSVIPSGYEKQSPYNPNFGQ